jgi:tyrosyl-tRNA synthetase
LYAYLVNYKDSMDIVLARTRYYRLAIRAVLDVLGVAKKKIDFVDASSYELSRQFTLDNYKLCTLVDDFQARDTGDEYRNATRLSVLLCPGLPALAEEYLNADFQFGGQDQVRFFTHLADVEHHL